MEIRNHITTPTVLLVVLLVAVALAGWGYYFVSHNLSTSQYSNEKSVFSVLIVENPAFKEADTLMQAGNLEAARAKYLGALSLVRDSFQEAYIKYWIANIDETLGDYTLAIREFKEVANTPISYNLIRAYAVVRVGLIYDLYGDSKNRASMITETFTGEPYATFLVGANEPLAYRRLYEYASSFSPVAISELQIANWYANKIMFLRQSGASTQEEYSPYVEAAFERIRSAQADIEKSLQDENASKFAPVAFAIMGEVFGKLALSSLRVPSSVSIQTEEEGITFKTAEDAFLKALELRAAQGRQDGYERFYYASFLERYYYPKRGEDLKKVLSNFLTPAYKDAPIMKFFAAQQGTNTWMNDSLTKMGTIDPEFKKLLVSLGWLEGDFR